jgi:uncharacterized SAM-binding protein YcdF (DUF218 family)
MKTLHISHLLEAVFNPYFLSFLLLLFSMVWLWLRGDGWIVRSSLFMALLGFFLFSTGWLPVAITSRLENQYAVVEKPNPEIKWVVVLSGGHNETKYLGIPANDILSTASLERLVEGVRLYRQIPDAKLLLSGGVSDTKETSEAAYLAKVALWFEVPEEDIVLEADSYNTAEEAIAIKKILHDEPFYLVTSAVHMPRAMALCKYQGLSPIAAPAGLTLKHKKTEWQKVMLPNHANLTHTSTAWHEILGFVWGRLRGLL